MIVLPQFSFLAEIEKMKKKIRKFFPQFFSIKQPKEGIYKGRVPKHMIGPIETLEGPLGGPNVQKLAKNSKIENFV